MGCCVLVITITISVSQLKEYLKNNIEVIFVFLSICLLIASTTLYSYKIIIQANQFAMMSYYCLLVVVLIKLIRVLVDFKIRRIIIFLGGVYK